MDYSFANRALAHPAPAAARNRPVSRLAEISLVDPIPSCAISRRALDWHVVGVHYQANKARRREIAVTSIGAALHFAKPQAVSLSRTRRTRPDADARSARAWEERSVRLQNCYDTRTAPLRRLAASALGIRIVRSMGCP